MASQRAVDSQREEFRKYLERAGALDALTKILASLYNEPEKPTDVLDYVRKRLGDNKVDEVENEALRVELESLILKNRSLEDEIKELKEKLAQYEQSNEKPVNEENGEPVADSTGEDLQTDPAE